MKRRTRKRLLMCLAAFAGLAVPLGTALILLLLNGGSSTPTGNSDLTGTRVPQPLTSGTPAPRALLTPEPVVIALASDLNSVRFAELGAYETQTPSFDTDGTPSTTAPGSTGSPHTPPQNTRRAPRTTGGPGGTPSYVTGLGTPTPTGGGSSGTPAGNPAGGGTPSGGNPASNPGQGTPGEGNQGNTPPTDPNSKTPTADISPTGGSAPAGGPQSDGTPTGSPSTPGGTPNETPANPPAPNVPPQALLPQPFQTQPPETPLLPVEDNTPINTVPEPGALALLLTALAGLMLSRRAGR